MKIRQIMTQNPEIVTPNESLQATARKMESLDVGVMPVCDGNTLIGMITDRDITIRATAEGMDPNQMKVSDVMTDKVTWMYADQDVDEAVRLMKEKQIRRLPIIDRENNQLIGIVSLGDLAVETGDEERSGETLEEISEPAQPQR